MLNIKKNNGFTLVELIIVVTIVAILASLSFVSTSIIGDRAIVNSGNSVGDFIEDSKFNLIKFKGDYLDIFIDTNSIDFKNQYVFSYVTKSNCTFTGGLDSVDFYKNIYTLEGQTNIDFGYFTGSLDTSISILGYKKVGINYESIDLDVLDNFKHDLFEEIEYKYDLYQDSALCSHIFVKKINKDSNDYVLSQIEVLKSKKDFFYDKIRINYGKNFIAKLYTGDLYYYRGFFRGLKLTVTNIINNDTYTFKIVN